MPEGYLLLEDGARFEGRLAVSSGEGVGEVVFTTNLTGYQEVLTDPSYAGQIVVMTAPMMGVYGTHGPDDQSRRPWVAGFIVRRLAGGGGWRSEGPLSGYLREHEIPTLTEVDTRAVTRHIREAGAMRGVIADGAVPEADARERLAEEPEMEGRDLATEVSTPEAYEVAPEGEERGRVLCLDYGVKQRSLDLVADAGFRVRVVPSRTTVGEMLDAEPAGLFVSNGPGDPDAVPGAVERIQGLADAGVPVFGICLGHQLVARAFGGRNYKLRYGHRGGNHPVRRLDDGAIEITSQNHGFAVVGDGDGIEGAPDLRVTHLNVNDGTVEGLAHHERPIFAVQYHPESAPGPHDSRYLFRRFVAAMTAG